MRGRGGERERGRKIFIATFVNAAHGV